MKIQLLAKKGEFILEKDMVVTVEPGIYIKDQFGVRIEDDILVKKIVAKF